MENFKIGSKIKCIRATDGLVLGREYVVITADDRNFDVNTLVGVVTDERDGSDPAFFADRFELVEDKPAQRFNVGDKIVMTAADSRYYAVGDDADVTNASDSDGHYWAKFPHHDFDCCLGYLNRKDYYSQAELYVEEVNKAGFFIGQMVEIINNDYADEFEVGQVCKVVSMEGWGVRLYSENSKRNWFFLNKEVEEYVEPAFAVPVRARTIRVGDIVELLQSDWPKHFPAGSHKVVEEVYGPTGGISFYIDGSEFYFNDREFVLVTPVEARAGYGNFELTEDEPQVPAETLFMTYRGVTVSLDPSVAFSRNFADSFINAVYN